MSRLRATVATHDGSRGLEAASTAGFTIVELLMVMGMLGMFTLFLTQLLGDGLRLWQSGETRAAIEDRSAVATEIASADFITLQGVSDRTYAPGREARFARLVARGAAPPLTGRLYATWLPFQPDGKLAPVDMALAKPQAFDWLPEVRAVVLPQAAEAEALLRQRLAAEIEAAEGELPAEELETRLRARLAEEEPRQPAELALRVLPAGEENGCYLALHRTLRPLSGKGPRWVDGGPLPPPVEPLLGNLLYVEFSFRSQFTKSLDAPPRSKDGPELCWDSARAGTFPSDHAVLGFSLDLDPTSLLDPLDDVMPAAVQVRVVLDAGPGYASTALLARGIDEVTNEIDVEYADRLPGADEQPWLKIGGEWIRYTGISGQRLLGVKRGQRFTKPRAHAAASRVHAGRESRIVVPIAVAREYWNG